MWRRDIYLFMNIINIANNKSYCFECGVIMKNNGKVCDVRSLIIHLNISEIHVNIVAVKIWRHFKYNVTSTLKAIFVISDLLRD